jgi:hypothetical protein
MNSFFVPAVSGKERMPGAAVRRNQSNTPALHSGFPASGAVENSCTNARPQTSSSAASYLSKVGGMLTSLPIPPAHEQGQPAGLAFDAGSMALGHAAP